MLDRKKICKNCKSEYDFAAKFCPYCGEKNETRGEQTDSLIEKMPSRESYLYSPKSEISKKFFEDADDRREIELFADDTSYEEELSEEQKQAVLRARREKQIIEQRKQQELKMQEEENERETNYLRTNKERYEKPNIYKEQMQLGQETQKELKMQEEENERETNYLRTNKERYEKPNIYKEQMQLGQETQQELKMQEEENERETNYLRTNKERYEKPNIYKEQMQLGQETQNKFREEDLANKYDIKKENYSRIPLENNYEKRDEEKFLKFQAERLEAEKRFKEKEQLKRESESSGYIEKKDEEINYAKLLDKMITMQNDKIKELERMQRERDDSIIRLSDNKGESKKQLSENQDLIESLQAELKEAKNKLEEMEKDKAYGEMLTINNNNELILHKCDDSNRIACNEEEFEKVNKHISKIYPLLKKDMEESENQDVVYYIPGKYNIPPVVIVNPNTNGKINPNIEIRFIASPVKKEGLTREDLANINGLDLGATCETPESISRRNFDEENEARIRQFKEAFSKEQELSEKMREINYNQQQLKVDENENNEEKKQSMLIKDKFFGEIKKDMSGENSEDNLLSQIIKDKSDRTNTKEKSVNLEYQGEIQKEENNKLVEDIETNEKELLSKIVDSEIEEWTNNIKARQPEKRYDEMTKKEKKEYEKQQAKKRAEVFRKMEQQEKENRKKSK